MQDNQNIHVDSEEINILHYFVVLLKYKKLIAGFTLACAVIATIISLVMPPVFKAETRILPPQASSSGISSQILGQLVSSSSGLSSGASGLISSSLGLKSGNDLYVGMLTSVTMYDCIIDKFDLMKLYKTRYREDARKKVNGSVTVNSGKNEIISVSVEDNDPARAAAIANAFIDNLKVMTQTFAVTEASKRRVFFEEQLEKIKVKLFNAEDAMQGLQEKTGALNIAEQSKAVITSIAELRAQIAAKEVELKVMKTYAVSQNPDLKKLEEALKGLKAELQKLEAKSGENPDPLMPTGRLPQVGTDYSRQLREVKYNETLFELMVKQYEAACVDEARDSIIIQVLDKAEPPDKKSKPRRIFILAVVTFSGFFLAIFIGFLMEHLENISAKEENRKIIELIKKYSFLKCKNSVEGDQQ
jgi:tyrosine-protein kinase Etk/Wzc